MKLAFLFKRVRLNMLKFRNISKGNSFFVFIYDFWLAGLKSNNRAFHRLCSLMRKMSVETAIVEDIEPNDNIIREEKEALCRYFDCNIEMRIFRLSFSIVKIENEEALKKLDINNAFLANALIVNFNINNKWRSYIYSSIVSIPMIKPKRGEINHVFIPLLNNYIYSARDFDCQIKCCNKDIYTYKVFGTYFCQQNTFTSVCAHAALCMALNNFRGLSIEPPHKLKNKSSKSQKVCQKS